MEIVFLTIAVLLIVEGFIILVWPGYIRKASMKLVKNVKKLRSVGWIELLIGLALIVVVSMMI